MRLLLTTPFLAGIFVPIAPVWCQVVPQSEASQLAATETGRDVASSSVFSLTSGAALRGRTGSLGKSGNAPIVDSSFSTRAVQPVQPQQGPGRSRSTETDPYAPQGLRAGSFMLYPALSLFATGTDNIDKAAGGEQGRSGRVILELKGNSNWDRHALSFEAKTAQTGYKEPVRKPDGEHSVKATLRLDLAEQTEVSLSASAMQQRESAGDVELVASGGTISVQTDLNASAVLAHDVGLLQLQLRGSVASESYDEDSARDAVTYTGGARVGYALTDQIVPFLDVEAKQKSYSHGSDSLEGKSFRGAFGIEVQNREKLSGEASIGAMVWSPDASGQENDAILFADASLTWSPNPLWTLTGGLETSLTSTSTSASSVATHTVSLTTDYAILRNLSPWS